MVGHPRIAVCGSIGGYRKHLRLGETACADCLRYMALYQRRRINASGLPLIRAELRRLDAKAEYKRLCLALAHVRQVARQQRDEARDLEAAARSALVKSR
jgi:hypothetical protein